MKKTLILSLMAGFQFTCLAQGTWTAQTSGTTQNLEGISFREGTQIGYVSGAGGTILKTSDGNTWTSMNSGVTATLHDITNIHTLGGMDFVWACGSAGTIIGSDDAGATWSVQSQGAPYAINAINFQTFSDGIVVGDQFYANSTNGGNAWSPTMYSATLNDVFYIDGTTGWMVGNNGLILKTSNGGANWSQQTSPTTSNLFGVHMINANEGWICGYTGTILKTTDGGTTWTTVTSGTGNLLYAVQFLDANNGWICGYTGLVLQTTDGGASWTQHHSGITGTTAALKDLFFESPTKGWVVGEAGTILYFEDNNSSASVSNLDQHSIEVYPNPAENELNISTEESIENVVITSMIGQTVFEGKTKNIDVSALKAGAYYVVVSTPLGEHRQKFIKK